MPPVLPTQPGAPRSARGSDNQTGPRPAGYVTNPVHSVVPDVVERKVYRPVQLPENRQFRSMMPTVSSSERLSYHRNQHAVPPTVPLPYGQPFEECQVRSTPPVVPGDGRSRLRHNHPQNAQRTPVPYGGRSREELAQSGVRFFSTDQTPRESGLSSLSEEQQRRTALALAAT